MNLSCYRDCASSPGAKSVKTQETRLTQTEYLSRLAGGIHNPFVGCLELFTS